MLKDLQVSISTFIHIIGQRAQEINILNDLNLDSGIICIIHRGTICNTVDTQSWIAFSVAVLFALVKRELTIELSLGEFV